MDKPDNEFQIVPETKIGALLDKYPQLEKTLLEAAQKQGLQAWAQEAESGLFKTYFCMGSDHDRSL